MKNLSNSIVGMANRFNNLSDETTKIFLNETYTKQQMSVNEIAELCNTYPNMIRRTMKRLDIPVRSRSEAQKLAIESGRSKHPTKGVGHSIKTKEKISDAMAESWENMTDEERQKRSDMTKAQWDAMTAAQKEDFRKKGSEAIRKAAREGSKLEKLLMKELLKLGYRVDFHRTQLVKNEKLEIDLFLPELGMAIEVDGPSHFSPIWGQDTLDKNKKSDSVKNGLLLGQGFYVVRIQQNKGVTKKYIRDLMNELTTILDNVKNKKLDTRYILIGDNK